jgi:hypothetical protein
VLGPRFAESRLLLRLEASRGLLLPRPVRARADSASRRGDARLLGDEPRRRIVLPVRRRIGPGRPVVAAVGLDA